MKNISILLTSAGLIVSLVGCGGGGGNGNGGGNTAQSFEEAVRAQIAATAENTDPQALGSFPAPDFPENTDPNPL